MSLALADDLELISAAARTAGECALALRRAGLTTVSKADGTPVTNGDLAVDLMLREMLGAARPDYGWLSEETADDPARLERKRLFVVDPIDGTRAYVKEKPWWVVSIGVVENGRPIAGAIFAPDLDEAYDAVEGQGARLNGRPIRPTDRAELEGCTMLADAPTFRHPAWRRPWPPMEIASRNAVALRLCLVASGQFDATLALSHKSEWDLAAGDLIAREAGCLVSNHKGAGFTYNQVNPRMRSLISAGPALHGLILERVEPIDLPD
jgi:myo-inositol-1(or 4)-monophosphatase